MKVSLRLQFMSKKRWDIDTMQEQEALLWLKVEKGGWVKGTRCDKTSASAPTPVVRQ